MCACVCVCMCTCVHVNALVCIASRTLYSGIASVHFSNGLLCVLYLCCFFGLAEFETCEWECAVCCRLGILNLKLADEGNLLTLNREHRIVKREQSGMDHKRWTVNWQRDFRVWDI